MRETTRIATPDSVEIEFRLAGPGSRLLAFAIDTAISGAVYVVLAVLAITAGVPFGGAGEGSAWLAGVFTIAFFLVRWGYFVFFEVRMRGQTPGKRALGIRVVREGGLPLGARHALLRNLLRVVDSLPPPLCVVGGASMLASPTGQRLGDIAAGTVVVRERFRRGRDEDRADRHAAGWVSRVEQGRSRAMVVLPNGRVEVAQIALIEEYFRRAGSLAEPQRDAIAWKIALPLLPLFDKRVPDYEGAPARRVLCENLLQEVLDLTRQAQGPPPVEAAAAAPGAETKARQWSEFEVLTDRLLRGGTRALRRLLPADLRALLVGHRAVTADLARAQSMGADPATVSRLNRLAISGHALVYGRAAPARRVRGRGWLTAFPRALRADAWAVALSALLFFLPAFTAAVAVRLTPSLAYDLVGPEFFDFRPASDASLHSFPQLMRPVVASTVMTNNLQVAILAFALGLSAGIGTAYLLVVNGIHLGAVAGWLGLQGQGRALWGWVMPHGGTEILAIIIAGAAGFLVAKALVAPGRLKRRTALRVNAGRGLVLELGSLAMLVVAGVIEGFVSPSALGFAPRLAFAAAVILLWAGFFWRAGARPRSPTPSALKRTSMPPGAWSRPRAR